MYTWTEKLSCAVTVCDNDAIIIYMNEKAKTTFAKYGHNLVGHSLKEFHKEESWNGIQKLLAEGGSNHYTVEKEGIHKIIHQTPWYENGKIAGLVEFSFEIPADIPHIVR